MPETKKETADVSLIRKRASIICILKILKDYTDANHTLTISEIKEKLEREYSIYIDSKAIRKNIQDLIDLDYQIKNDKEISRQNRKGEDNSIMTDWYLIGDFDDSELHLLIDSVLFSKYISKGMCEGLIEKLEGLSSIYFKTRAKHIRGITEKTPVSPQLFNTIEKIDEAITAGNKVSFNYVMYKTDKKRHKYKDRSGNPAVFTVSPYYMVATHGRFYLICHRDDFEGLENYRIDYIQDAKISDEKAMSLTEAGGIRRSLDLSNYMAESLYMFSGQSEWVKFKISKQNEGIISSVLDWFGTDIRFSDETNSHVTASVCVNEKAMYYWAMQFGEHIEVLEPQSLRERLGKTALEMCEKYEALHVK